MKRIFIALINSIYDMVAHDGIEYAGYLSFLIMLCFFPFLVFMTALLGAIGSHDLFVALVDIIIESPWARFIDALKPRIVEITSSPPQRFLTIAVLGALWTASSIFEAIRMILNRAYRITTMPSYLLRRVVSILEFLIVISVTISMLLILVILPYLIGIMQSFATFLPDIVLQLFLYPSGKIIRTIILVIFSFVVLVGIYSRVPSKKVPIRKAMPGAIFVICSWWAASAIFRYYIYNFPQVNLIYGSIAGVIIALLYFYICSIIFIIGGEFNNQYYKQKR